MPGAAKPRGVGIELRWMRRAAGLSGPALARPLGITQATISRFETGERSISAATLRQWRDVCLAAARTRVNDDTISVRAYRDAVDAVTRMSQPDYPDLLVRLAASSSTEVMSNELIYCNGLDNRQRELADLDDQAAQLRQFQPLMVPGILQTLEWARLTMLTAGLPDDQAQAAAEARVERSTRTLSNTGRSYHAVIAENALDVVLAGSGPRTRRDQLDNVLRAGDYDHITIQILPRSTPLPRIPVGGFTIYDPRDEDTSPTVLIDTDPATVKFASPDAIAEYETAWQQYIQVALDPQASAEWVADAIGTAP